MATGALEAVVLLLVATIGLCYAIEIFVLPATRPGFAALSSTFRACRHVISTQIKRLSYRYGNGSTDFWMTRPKS